MLFGAWDIKHINQWIHKPEISQKFASLIDSHITCHLPRFLKNRNKKEDLEDYITLPFPNKTTFKTNAATYASILNDHKHNPSCWKNKQKTKCRFAMPQPIVQSTYFTENISDANGISIKKFEDNKISDPPIIEDDDIPFTIKDHRIIVHRLKRIDEKEKWQVERNNLTTACGRCNTSIQILTCEAQAKASTYYCGNYMAKDPFELNATLPLILQADEERRKYGGSIASDAGTHERKAKLLLDKTLNKFGIMEYSDRIATAAIMNEKGNLSTHKFGFIHPWEAIQYYHTLLNNTSNEENQQNGHFLQIDPKTKKYFTISNFELYLYRGNDLRHVNYYDYTMVVGKSRMQSKTASNYLPGRKKNGRFIWEQNYDANKNNIQIIKSCATIPRIAGNPPPPFPGCKPKDNKYNKQINWENKARQFVEFFSFVFLPIDLQCNPIPPFEGILPWNNETSWKRFWQIFLGFKKSKIPYQRSVWRIFNNMVDNMRVTHNMKTEINKWRFLHADERKKSKTEKSKKKKTTHV